MRSEGDGDNNTVLHKQEDHGHGHSRTSFEWQVLCLDTIYLNGCKNGEHEKWNEL